MRLENMLTKMVNIIGVVIWSLLGLRFLLRLFSANPNNEFVNWIYETSGEILGPFRGIFPSADLEGFVFDFTALFAMLVYGIVGMLAIYLIDLLTPDKELSKLKKK